jgi:uncharacterized membrane protein YeaQ/YmgE (transglycosylase-associated protein family)
MIGNILTFLIVAIIAGFLARAIMPGKDTMSLPQTLALGAVGSVVGGLLAVLFTGKKMGSFTPSSIVGSVIGALIALLVYKKFIKK